MIARSRFACVRASGREICIASRAARASWIACRSLTMTPASPTRFTRTSPHYQAALRSIPVRPPVCPLWCPPCPLRWPDDRAPCVAQCQNTKSYRAELSRVGRPRARTAARHLARRSASSGGATTSRAFVQLFLDAGSHTLPWSLPSLESNRLAAKRAYYRRLDKVSAMQLENKILQDQCDDQKHRINVYEILVGAKQRLCCSVLATCRLSSRAKRSACPCCSCGAWESILRLPSTQHRHSRKEGERPLALSRGLVRRSSKSRRSISSSR